MFSEYSEGYGKIMERLTALHHSQAFTENTTFILSFKIRIEFSRWTKGGMVHFLKF